ncbi:MAG: WXG100 family type VII secretion target [Butyrivibrio sp.]|nr:WXG100 family type VII secretion target [Butyrivibrio sp.]
MAAKNTVNVQRMKSAAAELDNIYSSMQKQIKTLEETMSSIKQVWTGDASNTYLKQYEKNSNTFKAMANAIKSASEALGDSCNTYDQADNSALDVVQKMGRRG